MNEFPSLRRYGVIDASGQVINVTLWDGMSDWHPGDGLRAVESDTLEVGDAVAG